MSLITSIILLVVGVVIGYFVATSGVLNSSSLLTPTYSHSSYLNNCTSQVQSAINLLEQKSPSSVQISIVNSTDFGAYNNQTISTIHSWVNSWSSPGTGYASSCGVEYVSGQLCSDLQVIQNESMDAQGVAIKMQEPYQGTEISNLVPVLCSNGNLLPSSKSLIVNNQWANG